MAKRKPKAPPAGEARGGRARGGKAQGGKDRGREAHGGAVGHIVTLPVLLAVWAALMVGTVVTVAVAGIDLGAVNLFVALLIATVKASLVVLYFMHLRYDHPFNAVIFIGALLFVALFVSLALMDTIEYQPEMIPGYARDLGR